MNDQKLVFARPRQALGDAAGTRYPTGSISPEWLDLCVDFGG